MGYFRKHQDEKGRIIDPFVKKEIQYSTPCFAWAAAVLIQSGKEPDLVNSALLYVIEEERGRGRGREGKRESKRGRSKIEEESEGKEDILASKF